MSLIQEIKNGQIVENTTSSKKETKGNEMGYDQFLQILCAEMQYQDPLNPTSNTEYVAQMATFTQVESMLNMQNTMQNQSANDLVGKFVIMKVTSSTTGEVSYASGNVDYVLHQNGKTYLSIEDSLYNIEDLDTVADSNYMEAISLAQEFELAVSELPSKYEISLADKDAITAIASGYNKLTEYQKSFIDEDVLKSFEEKLGRYNELVAAEEAKKEEENKENETLDGTEGSKENNGSNGVEGSEENETVDGTESSEESGSAEETDTEA